MTRGGLTILQWNVGNFDVRLRPLGGGPRGMRYTHASASRAEDLADFAALIKSENPDIVTLQEVVVRAEHHSRLAALAGLAVAAAGSPDDRHTQAILVRPGLDFRSGPNARGFRGVSIRVRFGPGHDMIAVSTHSTAGRFTQERAAQHRALAAWVGEISREAPVVVGGDFNFDAGPDGLHAMLHRLGRRLPFLADLASTDWEEDRAGLAALQATLQDLGAASGPTAGAPRLWPRILIPWGAPLIPLAWMLGFGRKRSRLDYVWVSGSLRGLDTRVIRVTGPRAGGTARNGRAPFPWMDHDPVVARVAIGEGR